MASAAPETLHSEPVLMCPMEDGLCRGPLRSTVLLRLDGCIESNFLAQALHRLQRRHPKLRAVITGGDGQRRYEFGAEAPPIPFEIKDYSDEELPWQEEARRLFEIPPPPAGSIAAITVLRSRARKVTELILSVHHGVADGRTIIMLADELLDAYATAEAQNEMTGAPPLRLISPLRAAVSVGWLQKLKLMRRFVRLQYCEKRFHQTPLPVGRDIPQLSQWVHWVFTREETLRLVRRCRKEHASTSGALVAAVYCALMECLQVPEAYFKWHCPFDIHQALEGPDGPATAQDMGSFATVMRDFYKVRQPARFWDLARRTHEDIQSFAKLGGPELGYNLAGVVASRHLPRVEPVLLPANTRRPTLFFTNYGVLKLRDAYGSLRPRECTLLFNGDSRTGPWLIVEALVLGGRLNVGFGADGLEQGFWDRLQMAVRRHLTAATEPLDQDTAPQRISVAPHE